MSNSLKVAAVRKIYLSCLRQKFSHESDSLVVLCLLLDLRTPHPASCGIDYHALSL